MLNALANRNAATISQTVEFIYPAIASFNDSVSVSIVVVVPIKTTAPNGNGCRMSPTIVPKKIANRCHAFSSTPDGVGTNQTTSAATTVITPRNNRPLIGVISRDGVEFKALDYNMRLVGLTLAVRG